MIPFPYPVPPVTSARVHDYLLAGKDNFAEDRRVAEQMLAANRTYFNMVWESSRWEATAVSDLAAQGLDQFVVIGPGLPRLGEPPLHSLGHGELAAPGLSVVYLDHDLEVIVAARAYWSVPGVTVLDGDLTRPEQLLADPALHAALNPDQPVAVVCALVLQHLADQEVTAWVKAFSSTMPAQSRLAITHPGPDIEDAADAYRAGTSTAGVASRYITRGPDHLDRLLPGWQVRTTHVTGNGLVTITADLA